MKIEINPKSLSSFRNSMVPMTITIHKNGLFINGRAAAEIGLKIGDSISLEFEDALMFLKKSDDGFRLGSEMKGGLLASAPGLNRYIDTFAGKGYKTFKFKVNELKAGRHMLSLMV